MEADVLLIHFKKRNYKGQANFFLPGYEFFLACVVCNYTEAFLCSTLKKGLSNLAFKLNFYLVLLPFAR